MNRRQDNIEQFRETILRAETAEAEMRAAAARHRAACETRLASSAATIAASVRRLERTSALSAPRRPFPARAADRAAR
jgi:hypothetical protein